VFCETPQLFYFFNVPTRTLDPYVWFEVLTAVVMRSAVFWDITTFRRNVSPPSSGSKGNQRNIYLMLITVDTTNKAAISSMKTQDVVICLTYLM
jgi:hypothetical protein